MQYPPYVLKLITVLKRLPGVGTKTAERYAFQMLNWPKEKLEEFAHTVFDVKEKLDYCSCCGALKDKETCRLCDPRERQIDILCIVASVKDIFSIEQTGTYHGLYHVLGSVFSPLEGKFLKEKNLIQLKERLRVSSLQEVIIALDATLEGDATALFLKKELSSFPVNLSRLALGLPMGSSLDFIDEGTLTRAFLGRAIY